MEGYERTIPYSVLNWIQNFFLLLFIVLGAISLVLFTIHFNAMLCIASFYSVFHATISFKCISDYIKFRPSFALHGAGLLIVCGMNLIGFEFYALGGGLLILTAVTCTIVAYYTKCYERAYRRRELAANGEARLIT